MSDPTSADDVLIPSVMPEGADDEGPTESVESPGEVMRIGSMIKQLLEEVRQTELDEPSRERLREIYDTSIRELSESLSPDLQGELARLALPFEPDVAPTRSEEHTSELQSLAYLVCRLLLEKKK